MPERIAGKTYAELGLTISQKSGMPAAAAAFMRGQDLNGQPDRLTEPYRRSAWVRAAIDKIAGPIAAVAVDFYPAGSAYLGMNGKRQQIGKQRRYLTGRGYRVADQEQAVDLPIMQEFLRSPMKGLGYSDFVEATQGWLRMAGEAFWLLPDEALAPYPSAAGSKPWQIIIARPDRMRHLVDQGQLIGWEFTDARGRRYGLLPEQVIQLKQWNPYDQWRGLGQFEAARLAAETDWLAGRFVRNLAANNGDTGPYIVAKNGIPNDEQREQILSDLRAKRAAQLCGQFRPVFLAGDISIEDPQVRSVDAAYVAGRIENRHEVFVALGVPPSMADVKAAYSIGSASDFYQLILNTCVPAGDKYCDGLVQVVRALTGQAVEAFLDWDEHPVFQEVRKERLGSVDTLWSKGMPMAGISEYLGLGLPRYEGDEVGYLPFAVAPASALAVEPTKDPALAELDQVGPVQEAIGALRAEIRRPKAERSPNWENPNGCACGCSIEDGEMETRERDPKEVAHWKAIVAKRLPTIKAYRAKFDRVLMEARRVVLGKLEAASAKSVTRAAAADFMFSLGDFGAKLQAAMRGVSLQAVTDAGNQFYKEINRDDPWKSPAQETMQFLKGRENKLSNVPDEVFGRIKDTISEGLERGDTLKEISDAVRGEFNGISERRGKIIAQTETSAAYGFGRHAAMKDAGIQWKRWLTSGNSNVRAAHRLMNGAIVPIEQKFMVIDPKTGDSDDVMHPGDPDGAPWNVINCHCVSVASATGPEGEAEEA